MYLRFLHIELILLGFLLFVMGFLFFIIALVITSTLNLNTIIIKLITSPQDFLFSIQILHSFSRFNDTKNLNHFFP